MKVVLLVAAVFLFLLAALGVRLGGGFDQVALGLACFAGSFLVP